MKKSDLVKLKKSELQALAKKKNLITGLKLSKEQIIEAILSAKKPNSRQVKKIKLSVKQKAGPGKEKRRSGFSDGESNRALPEEYGETRLTMLVRDPYFVFAYWEINSADREKYGLDKMGERDYLIIRVYHAISNVHFDIPVSLESRSCYFQIPEPNKSYFAEIGLLKDGYKFIEIARSNLIMVPADKPKEPAAGLTQYQKALFNKSLGIDIQAEFPGSGSSWTPPSGGLSSSVNAPSYNSESFIRKIGDDKTIDLSMEIVIYGTAEPGMNIMLGGKTFGTGIDGKFSARFMIGEGSISIPIKIINPANEKSYEINTTITRKTVKI